MRYLLAYEHWHKTYTVKYFSGHLPLLHYTRTYLETSQTSMSPQDPPPSKSSTPRIAVKGFSLSKSINSSTTSSNPPYSSKPHSTTSTLGKRPRNTFASHSDSESDDAGDRHGKYEVVTAFGANGAIGKEEKKEVAPLVIPRLENRGLGAARSGSSGKNLLPREEQERRAREANGGKNAGDVVDSGAGIAWGLTISKRTKVEDVQENGESLTRDAEEKSAEQAVPQRIKTADEEALDALLGNNEVKKPDLIIPTQQESTTRHQPSETDAYRRAIATAPDVSTIEDYNRVPVEEFGAALLRGMGWKGEKRGEVRDVKRRQNLLGLGAKELKDAEELGAWVQKSDVKRLKAGGGGGGGGERRPKASEYRREKEKRDEKREERGGGSYRREREREREDERRDRDRDYRREGDRHRDRNYERRR